MRDIDLSYVEAGAGDPLVLLHGFSGNWRSWSQEIGALAHRWRVIAPDARGHGASSWADDGRYGYDVQTGDAAAFIERVSDAPVVIVGHSMGGATAMGVAGTRPELVRAVVLEDPHVSRGFVEDVEALTRRRDVLRAQPSFDELLEAIRRAEPQAPAAAARLAAAKQVAMDPEAYTPFIEETMFDEFDPDSVLSRISCPALLLQADFNLGGPMSGIVNDEAASRITGSIADCVHIPFPSVSHDIHEDAPVAFRRALFDFLDAV